MRQLKYLINKYNKINIYSIKTTHMISIDASDCNERSFEEIL